MLQRIQTLSVLRLYGAYIQYKTEDPLVKSEIPLYPKQESDFNSNLVEFLDILGLKGWWLKYIQEKKGTWSLLFLPKRS